jgi:toxin-antitoxin system, toxin component, fic family
MMEANRDDNMLIYRSADGKIKIDVRFESETVWLSLDQMATLFGRDKSTISRHVKNVFEEGELSTEATVANYATVQTEGGREVTRNIDYYNLDVIISVGYRVKSQQGTQFRIWATQRLKEYIIKGFALNDERFKTGSSYNYFKELLGRIREIRLSEKVFYQQIKDIYATSIDYDPSAETTLAFFKEVQNKLLWAVSGKTAAELMYYRANASLPLMGLTSTEKEGKVTKGDALIGKNYLNEKEISQLKLIVEQFLAYAEAQALAEKPMYMRDWIRKLRLVLTMNEKSILEHAGKISHEMAVAKATEEYIAYKEQQRQIERFESIKQLDQDLKRIAARTNNRKSGDDGEAIKK